MSNSNFAFLDKMVGSEEIKNIIIGQIQGFKSGAGSLASMKGKYDPELIQHIKKMINMHKNIKKLKKQITAKIDHHSSNFSMEGNLQKIISEQIKNAGSGKSSMSGLKGKYDPELAKYIQSMIKLHVNIQKAKKIISARIEKHSANFA